MLNKWCFSLDSGAQITRSEVVHIVRKRDRAAPPNAEQVAQPFVSFIIPCVLRIDNADSEKNFVETRNRTPR